VVAAGASKDPKLGYDWAVVSGGAPSVPTLHGKCRTGDFIKTPLAGMKGDGLWLFTRNPIDPKHTKDALAAAGALGFDTKELRPVVQRGCLYGAPPAAAAPAATPKTATTSKPASSGAPGTRIESGKQAPKARPAAAAPPNGGEPVVTRKIFFDLAQGGSDLGRVVLGL
jgi:hypothetical protein